METAEIIARGLSLETVEAARKYYLKIGEREETLTPERIRKLLVSHFEGLLDYRFNDALTRGEADFETEKRNIIATLPPMDVKERELLASELWGLFAVGFAAGYAAAVKDTEAFLYTLKEGAEQ